MGGQKLTVALAIVGSLVALFAGLLETARPDYAFPNPPPLPRATPWPLTASANGLDAYVRARNGVKLDPNGWTPHFATYDGWKLPPAAAALQAIADNQASLAGLRQGRGAAGLAVPDGFCNAPLPYLVEVRILQARLALAQGHAAEGLDDVRDALVLGHRLAHGIGLGRADTILGMTFCSSALSVLRMEDAALRRAPTATLQDLLAELNRLDAAPRPVEDVVLSSPSHELLYDSRQRRATLLLDRHDMYEARLAQHRSMDEWRDDLRQVDIAFVNRSFIEQIVGDLPERRALGIMTYYGRIGHLATVSQWLLMETCFQELRVEVAVILYKRQHGKLPDTLERLVPQLLPAVPGDPFHPRVPLRYDRHRVWSPGWSHLSNLPNAYFWSAVLPSGEVEMQL